MRSASARSTGRIGEPSVVGEPEQPLVRHVAQRKYDSREASSWSSSARTSSPATGSRSIRNRKLGESSTAWTASRMPSSNESPAACACRTKSDQRVDIGRGHRAAVGAARQVRDHFAGAFLVVLAGTVAADKDALVARGRGRAGVERPDDVDVVDVQHAPAVLHHVVARIVDVGDVRVGDAEVVHPGRYGHPRDELPALVPEGVAPLDQFLAKHVAPSSVATNGTGGWLCRASSMKRASLSSAVRLVSSPGLRLSRSSGSISPRAMSCRRL